MFSDIHEINGVYFLVNVDDTCVTVLFVDREKSFKIHVLEGGAWDLTKKFYGINTLECTQEIHI